ncbi:hypothetical protein Tco_1396374, partial [Tanacetum coccineum]
MNEIKALPPPENHNQPPLPPPPPSPQLATVHVSPFLTKDLLNLKDDTMSVDASANNLALALFYASVEIVIILKQLMISSSRECQSLN